MVERRYLPSQEVADYLGLSLGALRAMIWRREIPYIRKGWHIFHDGLKPNRWIDQRSPRCLGEIFCGEVGGEL